MSNTAPITHTTQSNAYGGTKDWEWWCGARRARSRALASVSVLVDENMMVERANLRTEVNVCVKKMHKGIFRMRGRRIGPCVWSC